MGSFYHRGRNKSWVFQYYKDGKKTYITDLDIQGDLSVKKQKEYKSRLEQKYQYNKSKSVQKDLKNSISNIVDLVLEDRLKKVKMKSLSQNTYNEDYKRIHYFKDFVLDQYGNINIFDIDQKVLNEYTDYCRDVLDNNSTTINNKHKCVQVLTRYGLNRGLIKVNPYENITLPKRINRGKDDIPNRKEYNKVKTYLDKWVDDYLSDDEPLKKINVIIYLQTQLGCRVGEIILMKWKRNRITDVGEEHSFSYVYLNPNCTKLTIHFKKKRRDVPLNNKKIQDLLKKIKQDTLTKVYVLEGHDNSTKRKNKKYLFNGKHLDTSYPSRPLKELCEVVGIDTSYSTHTFRHGFITDLFRKDVSLTKIGNVVGHSDRRMTELYGHLDTTDMVSVLDKV
jgi:integrase